MGLSSVTTALSNNIPTSLLVDCRCESVQQFFRVRIFHCFSALYFACIQ